MSCRRAIAVVIAFAALGGCDEPAAPPDDSRNGGATTLPAGVGRSSTAPGAGARAATTTTAPATTQSAAQAESLISIDGNLVLFPPARLRVDESDGHAVARLFSDDPKGAALDENYVGNSFYLQIELDPEAAEDLDGVQLTYRAPTSEHDDSPYGIFLEGRRWVLQPADLHVAFEGSGSPLDVRLRGTFLLFDTNDPTAKPHRAQVVAHLKPTVQRRSQ